MTFTEAGATKGIVVGVRDSDRSRDAVAFARTLATECGAPLVIATAYRRLAVPEYPEPTNIESVLLAEAEVTLGRMRAEARGVPADTSRCAMRPRPGRCITSPSAGAPR